MNNYCLFLRNTFIVFVTVLAYATENTLTAGTKNTLADCGCTVTLNRAADGGIYANGANYKPGDRICIAAGTYPYINLSNFNGTASNPITIVNCGGQVVVSRAGYGMAISTSSFFKLSGTGTSGVKYGFKVAGTTTYMTTGLGIARKATDFEVDHMEFYRCDVAIFCKTNPTCDPQTWEGASTMRNISFHDLYLHDINGEGFYIGHTSSKVNLTCNGTVTTVYPQRIRGLKIYSCLVDGTGWDGIQVASTPENALIYNNTVLNFGRRNQPSQQAGILLGGMSNGKVYNNHVANGTGNGIQVLGAGHIQIYNNVVVNTGGNNVVSASKDGIFIDDRPIPGYPALYVSVLNNTVLQSKRSSIRLENTHKTIVSMNEFRNNLMGSAGEPNTSFQGVVVRNAALNNQAGNIYRQALNDLRFVGASDYHLTSSSPAVNAGVAVNQLGITSDKDGLNRSSGGATDAGAYEYGGTVSVPVNTSPTASAGADKTITLPVSAVTVTGTGSDADGTVTSYTWKKLTGPASFQIVSAASASTELKTLTEGIYEFELTVTDNQGASAKDLVRITVNKALAGNIAPVANAGSDKSITLPQNSVGLAGTGSDAEGIISKYAWSLISGPGTPVFSNSGTANTTVSNLIAGTYSFRLTVTDNAGLTDTDDVSVIVLAAPISSTLLVHNVPGKIEAEAFAAMSGIKTETTKDVGGGQNISWVHKSDWLEYSINVGASGGYNVALRVSSFVNTAQIQIKLGSTLLSTVKVPNTGGYQNWQTVNSTLNLPAGRHTLRILSSDVGAWFLNWMDFTAAPKLMSLNPGGGAIQMNRTPAESEMENELVLNFPNPARSSDVSVTLNGIQNGEVQLSLITASGHTLSSSRHSKSNRTLRVQLPLSGVPEGVYVIQVRLGALTISKQLIRIY